MIFSGQWKLLREDRYDVAGPLHSATAVNQQAHTHTHSQMHTDNTHTPPLLQSHSAPHWQRYECHSDRALSSSVRQVQNHVTTTESVCECLCVCVCVCVCARVRSCVCVREKKRESRMLTQICYFLVQNPAFFWSCTFIKLLVYARLKWADGWDT